MSRLREGLVEITLSEDQQTVRHIFYRMISEGFIPKDERDYKGIVVRLLTELRRSGRIPYGRISDNTRWVLRSRSFASATDAVSFAARTYRRNLWADVPDRVEMWTEKDAVAGIISGEADAWCVPTMVFRGHSSVSYLYGLAGEIREDGRPTWIYYFGDHDPSGLDIERFVIREVRRMAPGAEIHIERLAVTPEQIRDLELPTRPTKKSDSRAKKFRGESVEVDALSPAILKNLVRGAILRHVDREEVDRLLNIEAQERETLEKFAAAFGRAA